MGIDVFCASTVFGTKLLLKVAYLIGFGKFNDFWNN
jgi:hypothetical protein